MKKLLLVLLSAVVILSIFACDRANEAESETESETLSVGGEYVGEWKTNTVKSRMDDEITYRVSTLRFDENGTGSFNEFTFKWEYRTDIEQIVLTFDHNNTSAVLETSEENGKTVIIYSYASFCRAEDFVAKEKEYVNAGNTYSRKKEIEITQDNWTEYFETVESIEWVKNAFDEAENLRVSYSFRVKEEYRDVTAPDGTNIAVEISADKILAEIELDPTEERYAFLDPVNEACDFNTVEAVTGNEMIFFSCCDGYSQKNGVKIPNIEILKNIEVLRVHGTMYLYE